MANQKHLDMLKQGVEKWNRWRKEHPKIKPDLNLANLSGIVLIDADFSAADLSRASLHRNFLHRTLFFKANLLAADLSAADLTGAKLVLQP